MGKFVSETLVNFQFLAIINYQEIGWTDTNLEGAAHLLFAVGGGAKT